jgi:hypothetical protein
LLTTLGDKTAPRVTQQDFHMDHSLEDRIRERAYEIWTAHGCVDGQADQHWLAAEREILARATTAFARDTGVPQKKRRPAVRAKASKTLKAAS